MADDTVEDVLTQLFGIERQSNDFNICLEKYHNLLQAFHEFVAPINAWLSCYIDSRNEAGIQKQVRMRDLLGNLFADIISNDLSDIKRNLPIAQFEELQTFFDNEVDVTRDQFDAKLDRFRHENPIDIFRGKFEIEFLSHFLHLLKHKIERRSNSITSRRYPCGYIFNKATILNQLSGYASTPNCLRAYIRKIALL